MTNPIKRFGLASETKKITKRRESRNRVVDVDEQSRRSRSRSVKSTRSARPRSNYGGSGYNKRCLSTISQKSTAKSEKSRKTRKMPLHETTEKFNGQLR
jgi:hypothetical protein